MRVRRTSGVQPVLIAVFIIGIVTAVNFALAQTPLSSTSTVALGQLHQHKFFGWVMIGSVAGWVLGYTKGLTSAADWVKRYYPAAPAWLLFVVDALVFVGLGTYLGTGLFDPNNVQAALVAGGTWPVGVGALMKAPDSGEQ